MIKILIKKAKSELQSNAEILAKVKQDLKSNDIAKEICKEYGFKTEIIDGISFSFKEDLNASAKTVDSEIQFNSKLIDEDFKIIMRYAIHELVHALQHMKSVGLEKDEAVDYLDKEDEVEAFQYQVEYEAKERGKGKAEDYVEDLIEYHEVPENEREDKKEVLLERVK